MLSIIKFRNPKLVMDEIRVRFKNKRLAIGYTQEALAERSGVSFGSVKRFETTGEISLLGLLKIAAVIDCLKDFEKIATQMEDIKSFDEILEKNHKRIPKRGTVR